MTKHVALTVLFESYGDEAFDYAKSKLAELVGSFSKFNQDKTAEVFFKILMNPEIRNHLSRDQIASMVYSICYRKFTNDKWVEYYMETLAACLTAENGRPLTCGRADRYRHRILGMIRQAKNPAEEMTENEEPEAMNCLMDCLKFTLGIYTQINQKTTESNQIETVNFHFSMEDVNELIVKIEQNYKTKYASKENKNARKGLPLPKIKAADVSAREDKENWVEFYGMVTWFLYYRICEIDGIKIGGQKNE